MATIGDVLIDSNVLIDVLSNDPPWSGWSSEALAEAALGGQLLINPVIYGEVSVRFSTIDALEAALPRDRFIRKDIPYEAAFLAGKAFLLYRRRRGVRVSLLPDFLIGAHAVVAKYRLLTRDAARYRTHFPTLELVSP